MATSFLQSLLGDLSFKINEENLPIRAGQLRARFRLYPVMVLSQILLEPLFVRLLWDHVNQSYLLWWLACIYVIHAIELLLWWRYRTQLNTVQQCTRWSLIFKLSTALVGLMWGMTALLFFPQDLSFQALMICMLMGLVAGSVTLDSVYPPALYIYVSAVILPLLARLMFAGGETYWILSGMLLLFIIASLSAGRELSKAFWKSLYQRHENDFLVMQLIRQMGIAEKASQDKSRFLASASHDLRQPLQALVLFSESLQDAAKEKETLHLAAQIGKSVGALVDMFDELLDISKFDAGVVKAVKRHFLVQDVFDRLQAEFIPMALAKGLALTMPKTKLAGYSDPHLLERILRNLISNAIRYTDTGQVNVSCQEVDGMLQFKVSDTGIGICAKNMPHIFEEYYQVDNKHRDRLKGLGLGLAIVRRMEALLGCKVNVVSEPNRGSAFSFSINQGDITQLHQSAPSQRTGHDLSGITVALIEDNEDIRQMAAALLEQWGCLVHAGEMPHEVLNKMAITGIRPDILICDYRLPQDLSAIDAIKQMKILWDKPIPALVLTGDTAPQTLQEIQASGALLLHKPIAPARLRSIVYFALNKENIPDSAGKN